MRGTRSFREARRTQFENPCCIGSGYTGHISPTPLQRSLPIRMPVVSVTRCLLRCNTVFSEPFSQAVSTSEDERGGNGSGFEPFPDLLAHSDEGPVRGPTHSQFCEASELLNSELTRSAIDPRSPLTIERITGDASLSNDRGRPVPINRTLRYNTTLVLRTKEDYVGPSYSSLYTLK